MFMMDFCSLTVAPSSGSTCGFRTIVAQRGPVRLYKNRGPLILKHYYKARRNNYDVATIVWSSQVTLHFTLYFVGPYIAITCSPYALHFIFLPAERALGTGKYLFVLP